MKRSFPTSGVRRVVMATAGIIGCVALIAYAAGGGIVVDTGPGGGHAFHGTSGGEAAGHFEGPYGIEAEGSYHAGWFKDSDDGTEVYIAAGKVGITAEAADMGISATAHGGSSSVGGTFNGDYWGVNAVGGSYGIEARSTAGTAGYFRGWRGVSGYGSDYGGSFNDTDDGSSAYLAIGDTGVQTSGNDFGIYATSNSHVSSIAGYFEGKNGVQAYGVFYGVYGNASSGWGGEFRGDIGLKAFGYTYGGYFENTSASGKAYLAKGDRGLEVSGNDYGIHATAIVGSGVAGHFNGFKGIEAYGIVAGIYAEASSEVAGEFHGFHGIRAYGDSYGGYFKETGNTSETWIAKEQYGVETIGRLYGVHATATATSSSVAGYFNGEIGIQAYGITGGVYAETVSEIGGEFHGETGVAGYGNPGVYGEGWAGGVEGVGTGSGAWGVRAENSVSGAYVELPAAPTKSLLANAPMGMVQNHPWDPELVVISSAPMGDEVATYTRGTAVLEAGEAMIPLSEAFAVTTNPDYGLTAHLTPVGDWADLYVAEKTTEQIVVRSRGPNPDAAFDYQVWGLRIGFEESPVIRERIEDAGLPMVSSHRDFNARRPELARHTAARRFGTIEAKAREIEIDELDLSRSEALEAAIGFRKPLAVRRAEQGIEPVVQIPDQDAEGPSFRDRREGRETASRSLTAVGADRDRLGGAGDPDVFARSFQPSLSELARYFSVIGEAEPGDVLVASTDGSGHLQRSNVEADPAVVGVVASAPGLVLGSQAAAGIDAGARRLPIVWGGVADVRVDADFGPIRVGDLLTTSPTPGHAMRDVAALPGTVLGKALQPLDSGRGKIQVLIMLR